MNKFKVGDEVRCINNNDGYLSVTIGKIYTILGCDLDTIRVRGNNGIINGFYHHRFELVKNTLENIKRYGIADFMDKINVNKSK